VDGIHRNRWSAWPGLRNLPCVYSHVALTNTVLANHTMGITVAANNTATLNGVLWFGNGTDTSGAGTITVSHAVTGDPAFATDGYHITVSSAAFDAGVDAGVTTDIDGDVRPKGSAPDLGADEISFTYVPPGSATNLVYTDSQGLTTTIQIPAGAVSETVALAYIPVDASPPPGFAFANHGFEMGVYWERGSAWLPGFTFNRPVTVTIHYSDQDVRVITDEHQLFLGWWTGDEWVDAFSTCDPHGSGALAPYLRDRERNVVGVPICHLSRFGLFGPTRRLVLPLVMRAK
jgi:hypothetical protein